MFFVELKSKHQRHNLKRHLHNGTATLRVVTEEDGFRLAGQRGEVVHPFGFQFEKQKDAIANGVKQFGLTAKKVIVKVAQAA